MKKILKIFGTILSIIFIGSIAYIAYLFIEGRKEDAQSKAYVESILPPLLATPTVNNFLTYMSEENKLRMEQANIDKNTPVMPIQWGQYKSYDSLSGDSVVKLSTKGEKKYAVYVAKAHFEKASPSLEIILTKTNGLWSLMKFNFRIDKDFIPSTAERINATQNLP